MDDFLAKALKRMNDLDAADNASLWDVMTTGLSRYRKQLVEARADVLRAEFYSLMADEEFIRSITYGPNDMKKVRHRFEAAKAMFEEVFDAHPA